MASCRELVLGYKQYHKLSPHGKARPVGSGPSLCLVAWQKIRVPFQYWKPSIGLACVASLSIHRSNDSMHVLDRANAFRGWCGRCIYLVSKPLLLDVAGVMHNAICFHPGTLLSVSWMGQVLCAACGRIECR